MFIYGVGSEYSQIYLYIGVLTVTKIKYCIINEIKYFSGNCKTLNMKQVILTPMILNKRLRLQNRT